MTGKSTKPLNSQTFLPVSSLPSMHDDLDADSLNAAIAASIRYYQKTGGRDSYCFGDRCYSGQEMITALQLFHDIVNAADPPAETSKRIHEAFDIYRAAGYDGNGTMLFTGYYEPVLEGSLLKTEKFCHPLYRTPEETVVIKLGQFDRKYGRDRLVGRLKGQEVVPHYSRQDIENGRSLEGRGLEIAWVDDPVSLFFLHIQGSGRISLPDGRIVRVSYAESNGKPFRSVTSYMVEKGLLAENEKSYEHTKAYLKAHPEARDAVMNHNERYIFFRVVENGPVGSLGLTVISGRSIATDPGVFPKGAPAFMVARKPLFNGDGDAAGWTSFSRFVFSHDAGDAIKGPGRVDLFCGAGPKAERLAGSLKEKGALYFLVPKRR
ncbi:MAG: MltA domain-containing protein [Syntrophales bacterium]|nr:MltA domain-containing protein [Syntrophales bacterium]